MATQSDLHCIKPVRAISASEPEHRGDQSRGRPGVRWAGFSGTNFYSDYNGRPKATSLRSGLTNRASWWFGLVGSDQAMEPWLDEAMAVSARTSFTV